MSQIFNYIKYKYKTNYVNLLGYEIAYIDEGKTSEVLLFIHGLGSYLKAWDRNIPELKNHFRCVAIDLPGYGKSSKQIHNGSIKFYTEFINEFIKKLDLNNVTLVGHSMGGQIALSYALHYSAKVNNLILIAPAGFETFTVDEIEKLQDLISPELSFNASDEQVRFNYSVNFYKMPAEAEEMIKDRIIIKNDEEFYNHCQVVSSSLFSLLTEPVFDRLDQIDTPTLILFGKNDLFIPNRIVHKTNPGDVAILGASKIKNSKLELLENCGHFLQYEKPDEFNSCVKIFFANNEVNSNHKSN